MDEAEWLEAEDSWEMLRFLEGQNPSQRKIHLFVCACCRYFHWDALLSLKVQDTVLVAEWFADGLATKGELRAVRERLSWEGPDESVEPATGQPLWTAKIAAGHLMYRWENDLPISHVLWAAKHIRGPRLWEQLLPSAKARVRIQCDLLREIFSPFAAGTMRPSWLAWNYGVIRRLAECIYSERRFENMPILADALEEAGCTETRFLEHCRRSGEHVLGCWVIDALLGKS